MKALVPAEIMLNIRQSIHKYILLFTTDVTILTKAGVAFFFAAGSSSSLSDPLPPPIYEK